MRRIILIIMLLAASLSAASDSPAPFSELEATRMENVRLRGIILQREYDDWHAAQAKLKADIEGARVGWLWNPETGAFTKKETPK